MKAILASVLAGLGLLAVLTTGSARAIDSEPGAIGPGGCMREPQDYGFVDLQGQLHKLKDAFPSYRPLRWTWHITVNGHDYDLDLGSDKTDKLKDGMMVHVTGRLERETWISLVRAMIDPPLPQVPVYAWVVRAETLEPVNEKSPPSFARITVRGKLNLNAKLGYPALTLKTVTTNGQTLVLDLGIMTGLGMLNVQELDGKVVEMEGDISDFHRVTTMCVEDQEELPIVHLRKITAAR